jgi:hypothetical protein
MRKQALENLVVQINIDLNICISYPKQTKKIKDGKISATFPSTLSLMVKVIYDLDFL